MWSNLVGYAPQKNSSSDVGWRIKWYQKHSTMTCSNGESECQREEVTLWRDPQSYTRRSWIRECTTQHGPWCSWVQEDLRPRTSVKVLKKGLTSFPISNIRKVNLNLELEKFTLCKKYMYTSQLPNFPDPQNILRCLWTGQVVPARTVMVQKLRKSLEIQFLNPKKETRFPQCSEHR